MIVLMTIMVASIYYGRQKVKQKNRLLHQQNIQIERQHDELRIQSENLRQVH